MRYLAITFLIYNSKNLFTIKISKQIKNWYEKNDHKKVYAYFVYFILIRLDSLDLNLKKINS